MLPTASRVPRSWRSTSTASLAGSLRANRCARMWISVICAVGRRRSMRTIVSPHRNRAPCPRLGRGRILGVRQTIRNRPPLRRRSARNFRPARRERRCVMRVCRASNACSESSAGRPSRPIADVRSSGRRAGRRILFASVFASWRVAVVMNMACKNSNSICMARASSFSLASPYPPIGELLVRAVASAAARPFLGCRRPRSSHSKSGH